MSGGAPCGSLTGTRALNRSWRHVTASARWPLTCPFLRVGFVHSVENGEDRASECDPAAICFRVSRLRLPPAMHRYGSQVPMLCEAVHAPTVFSAKAMSPFHRRLHDRSPPEGEGKAHSKCLDSSWARVRRLSLSLICRFRRLRIIWFFITLAVGRL